MSIPFATFATPPLSISSARILSLSFSIVYVGSIYISARTRLAFAPGVKPLKDGRQREKMSNERWRDDPDVIKARLTSVGIASFICCAGVWYVLKALGDPTLYGLTSRLGLASLFDLSWTSLRPHLITPILFFGPLYALSLEKTLPFQKCWTYEHNVIGSLFSWQGLRNVVLAPPTEELVFRGCVLSVLHLAGAGKKEMILLSPLFFGLAHAHHAWDIFNRYGRTRAAATRALQVTLFQLTYTTLFGCFVSYLFLRTSSLYVPISAHMFCNFMGFPDIAYEMHRFPNKKSYIVTAYLIGIAGFIYTLPRWTNTPGSFYWRNFIQEVISHIY